MDNNNNDNVIDFSKHAGKSLSEFNNSFEDNFLKRFPYIKLTKDSNGNYFSKEYLTEYSKKICYIVTLMKEHKPSIALYKYKVPHCDLIDFLNEFKKNNYYDEIIDIEKYIPENLA